MTVRTRFAPSPTGYLHIGGIRTAIFSWLYARHHQGQFILRIEDTDRERSTQEAVDVILEGMAWLGLDADEGPHYQTQRFDRYYEVIDQLLANGQAYYCSCSRERLDEIRESARQRGDKPRYDGHCRNLGLSKSDQTVVRFKNPQSGQTVVDDQIQGRVEFDNNELDDLIIARAEGSPTYNLTVVVDDMDMQITHVIRGDDHLNNTPRQINILQALSAPLPRYAHVPMILGADGKKLSKRTGSASVLEYRDAGYLPEALLNYLVRLGWSHGDQEIFSREDLIKLFDISAVNKSAAALNPDKLLWLNQHYLGESGNERLAKLLHLYMPGLNTQDGPDPVVLVEVQKQRSKTMLEIAEQSRCFYEDFAEFDPVAAKKQLRPVVQGPLAQLRAALETLTTWEDESIHAEIESVARDNDLKLGKLAQPLRVAVTGTPVSPSIDTTLRLLGKEKTLARIDKALEYIDKRASS
ncbi:MAG: glutamate--tRNA ligase [Thiotrichales bacterium]|nr:glutamate--tRNA ligase [Thiotrichales bacterium]